MDNEEQLRKQQLEQARQEDGNAFVETGKSLSAVVSGSKLKAPLEAFKLAAKLRKAADNQQSAPWIIAFTFAIACDSVDTIPVAGWLISLFLRPFLFIFLWGKGAWKVRLTYYAILLVDFIPIINIIPLTTACVFYAFLKSRKKAELSRNALRALET